MPDGPAARNLRGEMGRFDETLRDLEQAARQSSRVLVAYSGGKDALVTLDLCSRTFEHVQIFFMWLVPGLEHIQAALDFAVNHWHLPPCRQYPHFILPKYLKGGAYAPNHWKHDDLPELKLGDIYSAAMADSGIHMIATGAKKADSMFRRKSWAQFTKSYLLYPLADWGTRDVLGYLNLRKIPIVTVNKNFQTSGVDLTCRDLLRIYDQFPADFERIEKVFPYVRAVVKRREWYGIPE